MSMESDLTALLKTLCPRVVPDFAPAGTVAPWITYQAIGGQPLRFTEGSAASLRHTLLQVNVWAPTRAAALLLIRQMEDALCSVSTITARPASEATSTADEDMTPPLYGCTQDFDVWAAR